MTNRYPPARTRRLAAVDRQVGAFLRSRRQQRSHFRPWRVAGDDGFVLLETVLAIGLIAVVMAAFTTFFVNSVAYTSQQRASQIAAQVATSTVDTIRSLPASDTVNGHDQASVTAQFTTASTAVAPWLQGMVQATDPLALTAGSGLSATVPTTAVTQMVNNVAYKVTVYLGTCVIPTGVTVNASCAPAAAGSGIGYLRAVVAVTWIGQRCPTTGCLFVTSTLLSPVDDPLFSATPPTPPELTYLSAQSTVIGEPVDVEPTKITGVEPLRVAVTSGALPAGLFLDAATGNISGTPTMVTASTTLVLTLTDGFDRAVTATFTWTVLPTITTTAPAAQASLIGTAITPLTLPAATGGNPGYTWSDPGSTLPPGLTVTTVNNRAVISGTPTTQGVFPVTLTVADSTTTRSSTVSFFWTTNYPPLVATNPGPQKATVNNAVTIALGVTGGSGSFAWTGGATLPAGLTLSTAGVISGAPTTAGTKSVALVVTDTKSQATQNVSFTWTIYTRPSVNSPGNQQVTVGLSASLQLSTSCPNAPCSYELVNGPATFGISSSGLLAGTVTSAAQTFSAVTVMVTDSSGATTSSASFVVTVNAAPSIANPGNQTVAPGVADSLNVAALTTGGTAPLTYSAVRLPSWLTLNPSTGVITGTAPATVSTTTGIVLTVRDSLGISASSAAFSWIVVGVAPTAPLAVLVANGDSRVTPSWTAPTTGPVTSYTATLSPGGASCTTTALTCAITGLTNGVDYTVTVQATNASGTGPASAAVLAIPYPAIMSAANGMTLWLDSADPTVLLTNSNCTGAVSTSSIGCWKDKSGTPLNNFIQTTAENQPGTGVWNGLPAVNFPDSGDVLNSVLASGQFQTVFVAANLTNAGTAAQYVNLFGQATQDTNVRVGSLIFRSGPNVNDWSYNSSGTGAQFNWANGAQGVNVSPPAAIITTDQAPAVKTFSASVSNTFMNRGAVGQVGDVITFNRVLTTTERRAVEEYLANKWGVSITPQSPTAVAAAVFNQTSVNVSWAAPSVNGGAPVSGYTVTSSPGSKTCSTTGALTCRVTGLTDNVTYTFTVTASNSAGAGPPSSASGSVRP